VQKPSEERSDFSNDNIHKEFEQVLDHFPNYRMKMLLGGRKFSKRQL
jgi:hypothetical protein